VWMFYGKGATAEELDWIKFRYWIGSNSEEQINLILFSQTTRAGSCRSVLHHSAFTDIPWRPLSLRVILILMTMLMSNKTDKMISFKVI